MKTINQVFTYYKVAYFKIRHEIWIDWARKITLSPGGVYEQGPKGLFLITRTQN